MRKDPPLNVIGRWTYINVALSVINGATVAWMILGGKAVVILQIILLVVLSAFLFVIIMGTKKALDEDEDYYAVMGTLISIVLVALIVIDITWMCGGF